jgi:hypothetical protein
VVILTKAYGKKEEWLFAARQLIQKLWEEQYRDLPAQWEISSSNLPAAVRAREYNSFGSFQDELIPSTRCCLYSAVVLGENVFYKT